MRTSSTSGSSSRRQFIRRTAGAGTAAFAAPHILGGARAAAQRPRPPRARFRVSHRPRRSMAPCVSCWQTTSIRTTTFMRSELEAYAELNGWDIESPMSPGTSAAATSSRSSSPASSPAILDLLLHTPSVRNFVTLGLVQPVDDLVNEAIEAYGDVIPGAVFSSTVDDTWYAVPFFTRSGGYYVRQDVFEENGIDIIEGTEYYETIARPRWRSPNPTRTCGLGRDGEPLGRRQRRRPERPLPAWQPPAGRVRRHRHLQLAGNGRRPEVAGGNLHGRPVGVDAPPVSPAWTDTSNNEAFRPARSPSPKMRARCTRRLSSTGPVRR